MTEQDDSRPDELARLAEEIRLLVELVVQRAAPWLDGVVSAGHGVAAMTPEGCGWCPLCAVVAVARGQRPEFVAKLAEQAAGLIALLRAVLADRWAPDDGVHMPGYQPEPKPEPAPKPAESPTVQHIPVHRSTDSNRRR